MKIERTRYVVLNKDKTEIFCGLAKHYKFKPIGDIGNAAIKSYLSENKAKSGFLSSWWNSKPEDFKNGTYHVAKITESVEIELE